MTERYPGDGGPAAVGVVLGNGDGSFRAPVIYPSGGYNDNTIVTADLNGDGKLDLVIASYGSCTGCSVGGVSVLLGNGNGSFPRRSAMERALRTQLTRLRSQM
jgi:hypothetical protein